MEKALTEPLIVEPVLLEEDESKEEEYSEWKLLIAHVLKSSVNPGYQNRDFRKKDGTPVIDPDVYRKLQNDVTTISTWSSRKHWALYLILVFAGSLPEDEMASVPRKLVIYSLALFIYHFGSQYWIFKMADAQLLALISCHEAPFRKAYGVTMGYSKCTKLLRWWNDDSGITLRRPRTASIPVEGSTTDEFEGIFPPIYIHLETPGYLHIDETNHDDVTMKVDADTWALLQSSHKELMQTSAFFRTVVFFVLPPVMIAYFVVSIRLITQGYDSFPFLVGFGVLLIFFMIMIFKLDNQNVRMYRKVTQRVNTVLQKEEAMADLTLEFHDEDEDNQQEQCEGRRYYQFVRRVLVDPTKEKESKDASVLEE